MLLPHGIDTESQTFAFIFFIQIKVWPLYENLQKI